MGKALAAKSFLVCIVALGVTSIEARADCNARDFEVKEVKDIQKSGEKELAFVLTATEDEYNNAKKNAAGGGAYGLISGNLSYGEAQESARQIAQATKFDSKSSYASSYFSQTLSPEALKNYVLCLETDKERPGLAMWLQSREGDYFTFRGFWVGTDTAVPAAKYDAAPVVDGGRVVSKPDTWFKGKTEEVVVKRNGNDDLFLNLKVGGQVKSQVIVKDPPDVTWIKKPVTSQNLMKTGSHGPNPGCSAGQAQDCINPIHPGGSFVPKSAALTERSTSDPSEYHEAFAEKPDQVCVTMTQSTGDCNVGQSAQGRLTAIEKFPQAAE